MRCPAVASRTTASPSASRVASRRSSTVLLPVPPFASRRRRRIWDENAAPLCLRSVGANFVTRFTQRDSNAFANLSQAPGNEARGRTYSEPFPSWPFARVVAFVFRGGRRYCVFGNRGECVRAPQLRKMQSRVRATQRVATRVAISGKARPVREICSFQLIAACFYIPPTDSLA